LQVPCPSTAEYEPGLHCSCVVLPVVAKFPGLANVHSAGLVKLVS